MLYGLRVYARARALVIYQENGEVDEGVGGHYHGDLDPDQVDSGHISGESL